VCWANLPPNPRKIAFDADGALLVAEAGTGVDDGQISRRASNGQRATVLDQLPSFPYTPSEIVGPAAVRPVGSDLYWIQGLGRDEQRSGNLLRLRGGQVEVLAGMRLAAQSAPDGDTRIANPYDLLMEPDGTAYVSDASANVVWRIDPERRVRTVLIWTAVQDPVPTGLARGPDGAYYVALFSPEPHTEGSGRVVRFDAAGNQSVAVDGLTTPIAVAFDRAGAMLVLELASGFTAGPPPGFPPCSGRLLRIVDGQREVIADALDRPTDVAVGPGGRLYLTLAGAFGTTGSGKVVRLSEGGGLFARLSPSGRSGRCLS
jgi:sugar lactone lactonase YvrE